MEALDEQINPRTQSLDDQLERTIGIRETENTRNEDFIKMIKKEVDIFEKHGGRIL